MEMQIKGSAVMSMRDFIKHKYGKDGFDKWVNSLSPEAKNIYINPILSTVWFPARKTLFEPGEKLVEILANGDKSVTKEAGRYSAEIVLTGIYKLLIKIGSPEFLIKKASSIMTTFYKEGAAMTAESVGDKKVSTKITEFLDPHYVAENRIMGWTEKAMELSGAKDINIEVAKTMTAGDPYTEFIVTWK